MIAPMRINEIQKIIKAWITIDKSVLQIFEFVLLILPADDFYS